MTRKALVAAVTIFTLMFGALSLSADAQTNTTREACYPNCIAYPAGGFGSLNPTPTPKPASTPTPVATTAADATATNPADSAQIAFTGSESSVLGYVGAGLIGLGLVTLGARRRIADQA